MKKRILCILLSAVCALGFTGTAFADTVASVVIKKGEPIGIYQKDSKIYITDAFNKSVWVMDGSDLQLVTGKPLVKDVYEKPIGAYNDGKINEAYFGYPYGIAPYRQGVAITDSLNNTVRYINFKDKYVYTIEALKTNRSELKNPTGIVSDGKGNLYVADTNHSVIKKIDSDGKISLFAGSREGCEDGSLKSAKFFEPVGLYYNDDALYVADSGNHRICKIKDGQVTTIAGGVKDFPTNEGGFVDGNVKSAKFYNPQGLCVTEKGIIYVCDTGNSAIRKIENATVSTVQKLPTDEKIAYPVSPKSIIPISENEFYVTDSFIGILYKLSLTQDSTPVVTMLFNDVSASDWYYAPIKYVSENGLMKGVTENDFAPNSDVTRAMAVTVLSRIGDTNEKFRLFALGDYSFNDVLPTDWFNDGVKWAVLNGIAKGFSEDVFSPQTSITREQLAVLFYNYAKALEFDTVSEYSLNKFADYTDVSDWAKDAMNYCTSKGIINGKDGKLSPKDTATRAEFAVMISKFVK